MTYEQCIPAVITARGELSSCNEEVFKDDERYVLVALSCSLSFRMVKVANIQPSVSRHDVKIQSDF